MLEFRQRQTARKEQKSLSTVRETVLGMNVVSEPHGQPRLMTHGTQMKLSVVILNWNAAADTIRCAHNVVAWQRVQPRLWIVDNGSTDGSAETIAQECPAAHLVRNSINLGFAGGNNIGIGKALALDDAPVLLLNNDAVVEERDVIKLLETLRANEKIGFIGPLLFDAEHRDRLLSAGGKDPALHHHSHIYRLPQTETVSIVTYVPGTVIIGRAEVFRAVGMLDEDYFFSTEVADLCVRAGKRGYLSAIDPRARAIHKLSRSSDFRETLYTYYIIRNRFLFIRKFHRTSKWPLFGAWSCYSLALSLKAELGGKSAMARAVRLGLRDALEGRFGDQNSRVLAKCSTANKQRRLG
jgi:GT2 family glycosyltransferase